MDLAKEFKIAVKNPINIKNFFVIFFSFFLVLIIGLTMLAVGKSLFFNTSVKTACNSSNVMQVSSSVVTKNDVIYNINFNGNSQCFLNTWFTWKNPAQKVTLWVYDPNGNVNLVEPAKGQTNVNFLANSSLIKGKWRIILKTDSTTKIPYSGEIGIR